MLAIQKIKMYWEKECRTPAASCRREQYYLPAVLDLDIELNRNGIFLNERNYIQKPDAVYTCEEYQKEFGNRMVNAVSQSEGEMQERKRKHLLHIQEEEQKNKGVFYESVSDIAIPSIRILQESNTYRIIWYSLDVNGRCKPVRHGRNEEFYTKGSPYAGKNICNETAFVLCPDESGEISFNYRCVGYDGQHYEQYTVYFVNTDILGVHTFTQAEYMHVYNQMADLF